MPARPRPPDPSGHVGGSRRYFSRYAYVATFGWRSTVGRGVVAFAVDALGVYFGTARYDGALAPRRVRWSQVAVIEVFEAAYRDRAIDDRPVVATVARPPVQDFLRPCTCVGVRAPGSGPGDYLEYRRIDGWRLNLRRLRAAVRRFAPGVAVGSGPTWRRRRR